MIKLSVYAADLIPFPSNQVKKLQKIIVMSMAFTNE